MLTKGEFTQFTEQLEKLRSTNPREAYFFIQKFTEQAENLPLENRLIFYKLMAEIYSDQSQFQQSKELATKALNEAKKLSHPNVVVAELYYAKGYAIENLGDYDKAIQNYERGLEIAESVGDKKNIATGLINLGAMYYQVEKFDRALIVFNDALNIASKTEDAELLGYVYSELGILYSYLYEEEKSKNFFQKSYEHYLKAGKIYYAYNSLFMIGQFHALNKNYEQAIAINKEIVEHASEIGNLELVASAYSGLAWSYILKEDSNPEAAYHYMQIAEQYAQQSERHEAPLTFGLNKAFFLFELKKYDEALDTASDLEKLINEDEKLVNTWSKYDLLYLKSEVYYKKESYQQAYNAQKQFLEFAFEIRDRSNYKEVEDLRMRYESEQADLQKQILAEQEKVQSIKLEDARYQQTSRHIIIAFSVVVILLLAWFLIKIIRGQRQLLKLSHTDVLTGVVNRRRLMELGKFMYSQAGESTDSLSVLMLDVDDFKAINDNYGHKAGDRVLKSIAELSNTLMRGSDEFGRFGGEEFIALLPDANLEQAVEVANRLCREISGHDWSALVQEKVTVSIGVASYDNDKHKDIDDIIKEADLLLYKAKSLGKNQVCF
ncbi:diguanylate cyclase [Thalassotalea ganghwensis]